MTGVRLDLEPGECRRARLVGARRQAARARSATLGVNDNRLVNHVLGALAEIVVSRWLGVPFAELTYVQEQERGSDVESPALLQVRARSRPYYELNQRKDRLAAGQPYVLALPAPTRRQVVLAGWIWGWEFPGLAGPLPYAGAGHSWWVPTARLRPLPQDPPDEFYLGL